jgi:hypothetical protein
MKIYRHFLRIYESENWEQQWINFLVCCIDDVNDDDDVLLLSFSVALVENNSFPLLHSARYCLFSLYFFFYVLTLHRSYKNKIRPSWEVVVKNKKKLQTSLERASAFSLSRSFWRKCDFPTVVFFLLLVVIDSNIDWLKDRNPFYSTPE